MAVTTKKIKLWPKLRFERIGRLDWTGIDYEPGPLAALGKALQAAPQRPQDWAIGQALKDLSESPSALTALNRLPKRAPQETRALNVATHYLACQRLKDASMAPDAHVAASWGTKAASVKEAYRRLSDQATIELDALIEMCLARKRHATKADVLRDVDRDMTARAQLSGFRLGGTQKR